jgi:hypothetical protein
MLRDDVTDALRVAWSSMFVKGMHKYYTMTVSGRKRALINSGPPPQEPVLQPLLSHHHLLLRPAPAKLPRTLLHILIGLA